MNPASSRLFISTNTTALGFSSAEVNVACGTDANVLITMGEPYMLPYSTLYMCDIMCLNKSQSVIGYLRKQCYIENCNQNSTVYMFSLPLVGSWGCFFPFGGSAQSGGSGQSGGAYPSFWITASLLSLFGLTGFLLNVNLIVMSNMKRLASCEMRKVIVGVCAYEALAALILFLDRFLFWLVQGGPPNTIMSAFFHKYVIDPVFVRTFCSYLLMVVSCHLQIFRPQAFHRFTKLKRTTFLFCLVFPVLIYVIYFILCYPVAQSIENAVANNTILLGVIEKAIDKIAIGGWLFVFCLLFGLIMNIIAHYGLSQKLSSASEPHVIQDAKSCALCVSLLIVAELLVLLPMDGSLYSFSLTLPSLLADLKKSLSNPNPTPTMFPLAPSPLLLTTQAPPTSFDVFLTNFIPLAFLFEATLPILIPLIIMLVYRPYRRACIGFVRSETRSTKVTPISVIAD